LTEVIDSYKIKISGMIVDVNIYREEDDVVPVYNINILNISETTNIILNKLREEFVSRVNIGAIEASEEEGVEGIKEKFKKEILILIKKYFPNIDERTTDLLINHVIQQNIGLGNIEILLKDSNLEEIRVAENKCSYPKRGKDKALRNHNREGCWEGDNHAEAADGRPSQDRGQG